MPSHPLVKHWLAVARNKLSPPAVFRGALAELGRLLIYEASAEEGWLQVLQGQAETPCGIADVTFLDPGRPVKVSAKQRTSTLRHSSSSPYCMRIAESVKLRRQAREVHRK